MESWAVASAALILGVFVFFAIIIAFHEPEPVVYAEIRYHGWEVSCRLQAEHGAKIYANGTVVTMTEYRGPVQGFLAWANHTVVEIDGVNRTLRNALPSIEQAKYTIKYSETEKTEIPSRDDFEFFILGFASIALLCLAFRWR